MQRAYLLTARSTTFLPPANTDALLHDPIVDARHQQSLARHRNECAGTESLQYTPCQSLTDRHVCPTKDMDVRHVLDSNLWYMMRATSTTLRVGPVHCGLQKDFTRSRVISPRRVVYVSYNH
jgi:hypothetical protein